MDMTITEATKQALILSSENPEDTYYVTENGKDAISKSFFHVRRASAEERNLKLPFLAIEDCQFVGCQEADHNIGAMAWIIMEAQNIKERAEAQKALRVTVLETALRACIARAGNPDAAEGCRQVIRTAQDALEGKEG